MTVYKTDKGKWEVRTSWYDSNHKRHYIKRKFRLKSQAESFERSIGQDKENGTISVRSKLSFPEYFLQWFQTYKEASLGERSVLVYQSAYRTLLEYFPPVPMSKINRRVYQQFLTQYGKNHAKNTVTRLNAFCHACVRDAVYDGDIKVDFIHGTNLVFNQSKSRKVEYLSISEMKTLSNYLLNNLDSRFTSRYMILTALFTGARLGEIQALQWKDIDFPSHLITIKHSWNESLHHLMPTKNESSVRSIRITPSLLQSLQSLQNNTTINPEFVFSNVRGEIPTSHSVNQALRYCLKNCHIEKKGFHFHSLRHSHVAFLLANDIDIYIIAKRLGHSDIATTTQVYSYLIDEYKTKTDERIVDALENELVDPIINN